ncbi:MAG: hypothetical protein BWY84_00632 [Candidatus Aerophobetes bacterium ADurb.Bin490]|nr:MAG: hypothetical protein BWY84_00632 [Candidatus Aerophobetes bacterium ADurb.Bin490]
MSFIFAVRHATTGVIVGVMVIVGVSISVCVTVGVTDVCGVHAGGAVHIGTRELNTLFVSLNSVIFDVESTVMTELFGHDPPGKNTVLSAPAGIAPVTCCVPFPCIVISINPTAAPEPIFFITTLVPTPPSSPLRQLCGNSSCVTADNTIRSGKPAVWLPVGVGVGVRVTVGVYWVNVKVAVSVDTCKVFVGVFVGCIVHKGGGVKVSTYV